MIILGTYPPARVLVVLLLGQLILLGGVIVLSKAGFMKMEIMRVLKRQKKRNVVYLLPGLSWLASGAGSAAINIGATAANYPVALAVKEGVNPTSASLLVLGSDGICGRIPGNFVYAISKLIKNKTYTDYTKPGCAKAYFKVVLTSIVWFSAGYLW